MSRLAIRSIQIVGMGLLFATLAIGAHADTLRVALPASEVSTTFSLVISNTANGPTDLTLQSFDADGTAQDPIELDRLDGFASRSLASSDAALFPVPPATLTIQASTPLTGFLIAVGSEGGAVGFGTEQPVGATLFIPFVAPIESFENQLVVSNTTAQSATVTLTAFDALGAELSVTEALTLPGNGVLQLDLLRPVP